MTITPVTGAGSGVSAEVSRAAAAEFQAAGGKDHVLAANLTDPHRAGEVIAAVRDVDAGITR